MPTNPSDEPAAQAHALLEQLFALLHDCRVVVPQLDVAPTDPEPVSAQAERLLYFALVTPAAPSEAGGITYFLRFIRFFRRGELEPGWSRTPAPR